MRRHFGALAGQERLHLRPRWLRYAGITLAIAITSSAGAYLLLLPGLADLAYVSGPLLLLFITGTGLTLA